MRRDLEALSRREHDLLIVGGGIYGACLALEAATAGNRVALVEKNDFGSGTSFNSLRIIHGGLRYLQHLDFRRMRESIRARREWQQFAPELLRPTSFVVPTFGQGVKGYLAHAVALKITDLVGWDRNLSLAGEALVANGRMLTRSETNEVFAPFKIEGFNGAACWQDVVCLSSERLLIKVLAEASSRGALLSNYCRATELLVDRQRVVGATIRDTQTDQEYQVAAKHVINVAGPGAREVLKSLESTVDVPEIVYSRAFNLVIRDLPVPAAIGVPVPRRGTDEDAVIRKGTNTYFFLPWNGLTLIGTKHVSEYSSTPAGTVSESDIATFLDEINAKLSDHQIQRQDVAGVLAGWLPESGPGNPGQDPVLEKHTRIYDHALRDGVAGLTTVIGVKWTTAREVARRLLRHPAVGLGSPANSESQGAPLQADESPNHAGHTPDLSSDAREAVVTDQGLTLADIRTITRKEMALQLSDLIFRRSHLWLSPFLNRDRLAVCASQMARELGWDEQEATRQIREVESSPTWATSSKELADSS